MRIIKETQIEEVVSELCIKANTVLRADIRDAFERMHQEEINPDAKEMLGILIENANIAKNKNIPLCQDTGLVTVFIEKGEDVYIEGSLTEAVNRGIIKAYEEGYFRKSVVADPFLRENTGDNSPAIIHIDEKPGDKVKIFVMPKGFGSENKSKLVMFNPTTSKEEIIQFCIDAVKEAGSCACPPYMLGIGIGGTMENAAYLAKKALLRPIEEASNKKHIAEMEDKIYKGANALEIGIMGLGGKSTVMGVNIETSPTHIAGMPVAINISCHALRISSREI